jgi:hypothetical protein
MTVEGGTDTLSVADRAEQLLDDPSVDRASLFPGPVAAFERAAVRIELGDPGGRIGGQIEELIRGGASASRLRRQVQGIPDPEADDGEATQG